jgi:uncharacterized membrane protein YheB (UPF0754 family)
MWKLSRRKIMRYIFNFIILVGIGGFIGWITNLIAIKLLFRPYREINILGIKIQGVIPKRKKALADNIAKMIDEELISIKDITKTINSMEIEHEIEKIVDRIVEGKLKTELISKFPMLAMFLSDSIMAKIKTYLIEVINENRVELVEVIAQKLESSVDFKEVVKNKIEDFSLIKLERIITGIAKNELKHLEILGAVLGSVIGLVQFIVTDIIMTRG